MSAGRPTKIIICNRHGDISFWMRQRTNGCIALNKLSNKNLLYFSNYIKDVGGSKFQYFGNENLRSYVSRLINMFELVWPVILCTWADTLFSFYERILGAIKADYSTVFGTRSTDRRGNRNLGTWSSIEIRSLTISGVVTSRKTAICRSLPNGSWDLNRLC